MLQICVFLGGFKSLQISLLCVDPMHFIIPLFEQIHATSDFKPLTGSNYLFVPPMHFRFQIFEWLRITSDLTSEWHFRFPLFGSKTLQICPFHWIQGTSYITSFNWIHSTSDFPSLSAFQILHFGRLPKHFRFPVFGWIHGTLNFTSLNGSKPCFVAQGISPFWVPPRRLRFNLFG